MPALTRSLNDTARVLHATHVLGLPEMDARLLTTAVTLPNCAAGYDYESECFARVRCVILMSISSALETLGDSFLKVCAYTYDNISELINL